MASFEINMHTYHDYNIKIKHSSKGLNMCLIGGFGEVEIVLNKYDVADLIKALEVFKENQE